MLRKENFICDTTDLGEDGLEIGSFMTTTSSSST